MILKPPPPPHLSWWCPAPPSESSPPLSGSCSPPAVRLPSFRALAPRHQRHVVSIETGKTSRSESLVNQLTMFIISNVTTSPSGFGDDVCEMKQNRGWIFPPDATVQSAPPVGVSTGGAAPSAHRWGSVTNYMLTSWSLSRSHACIRVSSYQRCEEPWCNCKGFHFYFSPSKSGAAG